MKLNIKALLCLSALAICLAAGAQDLKPTKDKQTKKYGYKNKQKEWVIAPAFDDAKKFDDDGCALVKVDGKYGLIDLEGQWVPFVLSASLAAVRTPASPCWINWQATVRRRP